MPTTRRREVLGYLAAHTLTPRRARRVLLKAAGVQFDEYAMVLSGLRLSGLAPVRIGANAFLNHDCLIDAAAEVTIGRDVALSNRVALVTSSHDYSVSATRAGVHDLRPIVIEEGAWLGSGATVLGGVTVGAGAVVGAGALVLEDVPAHTMWVGVPARKIRDLPV